MGKDYTAEINEIDNDLQRISARLARLENDADFIQESIISRDSKLYENRKKINYEIVQIKDNITAMKDELKQNIVFLNLLIEKFKDSVKKDELEMLQKRVDDITFERFITKKDLEDLRKDND